MSKEFLYDVFLSHNQADNPRVRRLAERLRAAGVRVWLDEWVIRDIIAPKVDVGREQSRVLLLCISPAALASGWVALERSTTFHRDPANAGRRFIPLLLGDCTLPDTLRRYKVVDFREESEVAFAEVLAACRPASESVPSSTKPNVQKRSTTKKSKTAKPLAVLERELMGHSDWVSSGVIAPSGKWAASGSADRTIRTWDLKTGEVLATMDGHTDELRTVVITPDGKLIVSGSDDASVRVWDAISGRELAKLKGHSGRVASVVALNDNAHVLSGGGDRTLRLWELSSRLCIKTIKCGVNKGDAVVSTAVNLKGNRALSGHQDGLVRLWNLDSGECLRTFKGHAHAVNCLQFSPDQLSAVSSSDDRTIRVWDLKVGTGIGVMEGHVDGVKSVAISPDGTIVASAGFMDETVRLWDWTSAACFEVIALRGNEAAISVAFSPDGSRIILGCSWPSVLQVYRLTGAQPKPSAEATRRYVNAKVVLLGEGTVGKTSLAHRLIEDKYVIHDRTHGMNVWRMNLPLPPDATLEREALLWDLAGQEDYRLIHQLFLEQTALALLLVNPQKEDPFIEAGDWIKALKTAVNHTESVHEATKLLIYSQVDVGGPKLGSSKIEEFRKQHGFTDWLLTSAKNGRNCSDKKNKGEPSKLKRLIAKSIPWDKLPWTSTPRMLAELKNAVMAMRDESDIRLLRFAELSQRLQQALPGEKFADSDLRTAVRLLANHGLAHTLKFGDLVLLRPDLINGYAGAVIRAARAHTDEIGSLLEADIYRSDFDFTGVERLKHRPDEELLLRALVPTFLDHSLCIAEDTPHGRHLVFPSQYRREKDLPHEPDILVSYTFSGEWQTVWTTLVVRLWYSHEFGHRELWRNAAEFESAKRKTLGLMIEKAGDGAAKISLYFDSKVPDELRVVFIEYVHRHLAKYACDVTRDRRYVCPECGKLVNDLAAVRRRLEAKKDFITCQECDEKVPFIDFIEQRLKSDPVARQILAMDDTATRELDTQALEQILIGHMMAIAGEADQIFRPVTMFDYGIDGEVEFKDNDGKASGKRIYIQLKSGNSYLRTRKGDGNEVFDVKDTRHLEYWISQPVDVYLVIRQTDELSGKQVIRWMNVTRYLKARKDKRSRLIVFDGEKLDMKAVWKVRDQFFFR